MWVVVVIAAPSPFVVLAVGCAGSGSFLLLRFEDEEVDDVPVVVVRVVAAAVCWARVVEEGRAGGGTSN